MMTRAERQAREWSRQARRMLRKAESAREAISDRMYLLGLALHSLQVAERHLAEAEREEGADG